MKPATEILLSAAFVLTSEENWFGKGGSENPDQMCAYIALAEACATLYPTSMSDTYAGAYAALSKAIGGGNVICFNDTHTHAEVLDALYKAAELSEES